MKKEHNITKELGGKIVGHKVEDEAIEEEELEMKRKT